MSAPLILPTVTSDLVRHAAHGQLGDLCGRRFDVRIGVRGTEFESNPVLPSGGFDDEHLARPRIHRTLQSRHSDAAQSDDHHVLAGTYIGGSRRRAPTRRHAAADESGCFERDRGVDLDHRRPVHDQIRRVRPEQRIRVDVLVARLNAKCPVRHRRPRHQPHAAIAQIALTRLTRRAHATGRDERGGDVIAWRLDLTLAWVADLDLLDRPRLMETPDQCTFGFHRGASDSAASICLSFGTSTLPVPPRGMASSESTTRHTVGTLNELNSFRAADRR